MKKILSIPALALTTALALSACGGGETESENASGLPSSMAWTTYGTGTSTYADTAAVAEALTSGEGVNIRIIPSDTAIGRMTPLKNGQAQFERGGDEYIYAFEADYDFAVEDWGPQDVQMVWAPTAPHGFMIKDSSGIESIEDLKGKKVPRATANPSVQNKTEALLAYGGLTWDDVEVVDISYGDQADALKNGQIDVLYQQVYGSSLFELEASEDVSWLDLPETEGEAADRLEEIAPSTFIDTFSNGPGQDEGEETNAIYYTVPVITYGETSEDEVYSLVKAINDNFDGYKDVTQTTPGWGIDEAQIAPTQVSFHPGLIKYLEEQGKWSEEAAAKNDELIERGEAIREEWPKFVEQAGGEIDPQAWSEWKDENVPQ